MVEEGVPVPGLINLFGLPVGARSQTPLPTALRLDQAPSSAANAVKSTHSRRGEAVEHKTSQLQPAAPILPPHPEGSAQRRNQEAQMPPPPIALSNSAPIDNRNSQNSIPIRHSRSIAHIDMSEDDLRSWAAAAEALLPTLASVDQDLSNSTLDDKVSGRRR